MYSNAVPSKLAVLSVARPSGSAAQHRSVSGETDASWRHTGGETRRDNSSIFITLTVVGVLQGAHSSPGTPDSLEPLAGAVL